jgi:hypothetical protein
MAGAVVGVTVACSHVDAAPARDGYFHQRRADHQRNANCHQTPADPHAHTDAFYQQSGDYQISAHGG